MLDALVALCTTDEPAAAAEVLGLGRTQTADVATNSRLPQAPTARVDAVYSGVVYEALDVDSLSPAARRRASSWLAVTSGLFGLLRPTDRIPAYRLSGHVSLPGIGTVSTYWRRRLDGAVRVAAGRGLVVDLRSMTYASFWRPPPEMSANVVTIRVLDARDGARTVVSHLNKATKGRIARALLEDGTVARTPARFAEQLRALGWKVESGSHGRHGTRLDVLVSEL